jgi:hypothetical protein
MRDMTDAEVLAAANARYEAFRVLLPKVQADLEAAFVARGSKMNWESNLKLLANAADAAARLAARDGDASQD